MPFARRKISSASDSEEDVVVITPGRRQVSSVKKQEEKKIVKPNAPKAIPAKPEPKKHSPVKKEPPKLVKSSKPGKSVAKVESETEESEERELRLITPKPRKPVSPSKVPVVPPVKKPSPKPVVPAAKKLGKSAAKVESETEESEERELPLITPKPQKPVSSSKVPVAPPVKKISPKPAPVLPAVKKPSPKPVLVVRKSSPKVEVSTKPLKPSRSVKPMLKPSPKVEERKISPKIIPSEEAKEKGKKLPKRVTPSRVPPTGPGGKATNAQIITILEEIARIYGDLLKLTGDTMQYRFRQIAFGNGAKALKGYKGPYDYDTLKAIPDIGASIAAEIENIYATGQSLRLTQLIEDLRTMTNETEGEAGKEEKSDRDEAMKLFLSIKYIGDAKAEELFGKGYRTMADLKADKKKLLTRDQKLGVKHYGDLRKEISYKEMKDWHKVFVDLFRCQDYITKPEGDEFRWAMVGSFRRGEAASSDIDLLVMGKTPNEIYEMLDGHAVDYFSQGDREIKALVRLGSKTDTVRHIDIVSVDEEEWPYALLHYTGSARLNMLMQKRAKEVGFKILNAFSLINIKDKKIPATTEKDIFKYLKLKYLKTENRSEVVKLIET